jgi:hypothetical protein
MVSKEIRRSKEPDKIASLVPPLDVSIPVAHPGEGYILAETLLGKNEPAVLDIVLPAATEVDSWCCYGRPVNKKQWVAVQTHPDVNGRYTVPIPGAEYFVWGFGRAPQDAEDGEVVWRVHSHNDGPPGEGGDVWLRLVLRLRNLATKSAAMSTRASA